MRWRKLIKDNQKNFSRLHMLIDVFVIAASYALAWLIRFQGIFEHSAVQSKTVQEYMFMLIFIIPGYVLLYQAMIAIEEPIISIVLFISALNVLLSGTYRILITGSPRISSVYGLVGIILL